MPTKTLTKMRAKSPAAARHDPLLDPVERLKLLARKYPKVTESLEFALEIGIIAAQALRQIAVGVGQGTAIVARQHRATAVASKGRKRAASAASKSR